MTLHSSTVCSPPSVFHSLPRPTAASTDTGDDDKEGLKHPRCSSSMGHTHAPGEVLSQTPSTGASQTGGKAA